MPGRRARSVAALAVSVLALVGAVAWWSGEVPRWSHDGAQMIVPPPISPQEPFATAVPEGARVLFVGDSNTAGSRAGGPDQAYPAIFAEAVGGKVAIVVHAFGGATAPEHAARAMPQGAFALAFVMLGTNDAAPRGILAAREPVPIARYRADLARIAARLQTGGGRVVILAPPPVGTRAMARRIAPYRLAAAEVAQRTGSAFLDPAEAFAGSREHALLRHDALHLAPEAQRILGLWLAARTLQTTSASVAGSSSTGKPSPPSASHPS